MTTKQLGSRKASAHAVHELLTTEKLTGPQIAERLHLSLGYVQELMSDPDGSKRAARLERYRGVCEVCGTATTGSNGPNAAPKRCVQHPAPRPYQARRNLRAQKRRELIVELWAKGLPISQIAERLDTTPNTIRVEMARMRKTGKYHLPHRYNMSAR